MAISMRDISMRDLSLQSAKDKFEHDYVNSPPDDLICLICTFVARDPRQVDCCGKIYCQDCLEKLGKRKPCPNCRDTEWESFKDKKS